MSADKKTILITGAGGSIGSELCRQLRDERLILVGHSEEAIYRINQEIPGAVPVIADIRDFARMKDVFFEHRPDFVFHAAAMKHLPLAEKYPMEAVQTNIIGTRNVAIASYLVSAGMVFISTDKAVYPSCVMGKTKRIAELYCSSFEHIKTVRFGNVLESSGSVIPLFRKQIASGGPVTVTHPDIERYFMPIEDAVKLALFAMHCQMEYTLYVPKMEKHKIADIARELIGDSDVNIVFTGLREGEKLTEQLLYDHEMIRHQTDLYYYSDVSLSDPTWMNALITDLEKGNISQLEDFDYG